MKRLGLACLLASLVVFMGMASRSDAEARKPVIGMVQFGEEPNVELCKKGILKALGDEGFRDGENIQIIYKSAQSDFAMVHAVTQDLVMRKVDILTPLSTPCLQSAVQAASRNKNLTVVFTYAYDPYRVGAAKSPTDHLPNMTGISCFPPIEKVLDVIRETFPERKKVGIVWNSSEANSEAVLTKVRSHAASIGLEIVEATVTGPAEVLEASRSLARRGVQVFLNSGDNTLNIAYDSFTKVARDNKIPVFSVDSELTQGTLIIIGSDYYQTGYDGGKYISRVLKGEKTSDLPIYQTPQTSFIINLDEARRQGFQIPEAVMKHANKVIDGKAGSAQDGH